MYIQHSLIYAVWNFHLNWLTFLEAITDVLGVHFLSRHSVDVHCVQKTSFSFFFSRDTMQYADAVLNKVWVSMSAMVILSARLFTPLNHNISVKFFPNQIWFVSTIMFTPDCGTYNISSRSQLCVMTVCRPIWSSLFFWLRRKTCLIHATASLFPLLRFCLQNEAESCNFDD